MSGFETENEIVAAGKVGARIVREFLEGESTDKADLDRAKIGSSAMSNYVKLLQVQSAREATAVTILTHSVQDEKEFQKLVLSALPGTVAARALAEHSVA